MGEGKGGVGVGSMEREEGVDFMEKNGVNECGGGKTGNCLVDLIFSCTQKWESGVCDMGP